MGMESRSAVDLTCYHCGDDCDRPVHAGDRVFCCDGCRLVFEILSENGLTTYYRLTDRPGSPRRIAPPSRRFAFLDDPAITGRLVGFRNRNRVHVSLSIPLPEKRSACRLR